MQQRLNAAGLQVLTVHVEEEFVVRVKNNAGGGLLGENLDMQANRRLSELEGNAAALAARVLAALGLA